MAVVVKNTPANKPIIRFKSLGIEVPKYNPGSEEEALHIAQYGTCAYGLYIRQVRIQDVMDIKVKDKDASVLNPIEIPAGSRIASIKVKDRADPYGKKDVYIRTPAGKILKYTMTPHATDKRSAWFAQYDELAARKAQKQRSEEQREARRVADEWARVEHDIAVACRGLGQKKDSRRGASRSW